MTRILTFLVVSVLLLPLTDVQAQMSKQQKKALKKQLKEYKKNPDSYQAMLNSYKKKIDNLEKEVTETEKLLKECRVRQVELEDSMMMVSALIVAQPSPEESTVVSDEMPANGPAFSVQLGYYEAFNINEYFTSKKVLTFENTGKGNRYVVRYFTDQSEAERFAEDIRAMGIKDAFVANYLNGERVTKEEMKTFMSGQGK